MSTNNYYISNDQFKLASKKDFGFYSNKNELIYFNGKDDVYSLKAKTTGNLSLEITKWNADEYSWNQSSIDKNSIKLNYQINNLEPETYFTISVNNEKFKRIKSSNDGSLEFNFNTGNKTDEILIEKN